MVIRETRGGKQTKAWILETALNLFNEFGAQAVSTKRIAKEMGISPGNLYYHFKNKEEIIRTIMQNKIGEIIVDWENQQDVGPLKKIIKILNHVLLSWQDHPFIKKELVPLLDNDPELRKLYQETQQIVMEKSYALFQEFIEEGLLQIPEDPKTAESLITVSWLIIEYWLNFLTINNMPVTENNLSQGIDLIFQVWMPYFSKEAKEEIRQALKDSQV